MKRILFISFAILMLSFSVNQQKQHILFFGDSITQAGVGPNGYITEFGKMLKEKGLSESYQLTGAGIGGNKVYDLYLRLEEDVLAKNPTTVVIWVGVNDVWHKRSFGTGTDPDKFEKFYNALIKNYRQEISKSTFVHPPLSVKKQTSVTSSMATSTNTPRLSAI